MKWPLSITFSAAAMKMGGSLITYGSNDLQIVTGESLSDTARVLSGYLDVLVVRTAGDPAELREMASAGTMAIVNAMTADEHPPQGLSDFAMMKRRFSRLDGLRMLYLGEGNNTAVALALAAARVPGFHATFFTPEFYGLPEAALQQAREFAARSGALVEECHDPPGPKSRPTSSTRRAGRPPGQSRTTRGGASGSPRSASRRR